MDSTLMVLSAALFSLPFCSVARLAPNPAFWGQWVAVVCFALWWLVKSWGNRPNAPSKASLTPMTLTFAALALVTLVQTSLHQTRFAAESVLAATVLLIAALASHHARNLVANGQILPFAQAAAFGLVIALWINTIGVALGFAGLGVVFGHLVPVAKVTRSVGFIGQANQLGFLAVLAIAAVVALRLRGKLPYWLALLTFVVASLVCATTGSRIALVAFAIMVALYAWHSSAEPAEAALPRRWRQLGLATALFAAIQLGWAVILPQLSADGISAVRGGDAGRMEMLADAMRLWAAHPLLGVGYGNYAGARLFELQGPIPAPHADHSHNIATQILAEWGLLGAVPVALALLFILPPVFRRGGGEAGSIEQRFFGFAVVALMAYSLVEYPLWLANFLLPFALMAGALVQPHWSIRGRPLSPARWLSPMGALALMGGCAFGAWDYLRSQDMAMRMGAQIGAGKYVVSNVSFADATRVAVGTLFPVHAEIMHARTLPLDGDLPEYRLEVAGRALIAIPGPETIARYLAHSTLAMQQEKAMQLAASIKRRNKLVYDKTLEFLDVLAEANPQIAELRDNIIAAK